MKKLYALMIGLVVALLVAGCASSSGSAERPSIMTQERPSGAWELVELPSESGLVPNGITLEFSTEDEDSRVFGFSGVNQYQGGVTIDPEGGTLSFGMMVTTRKAGPNMAFEATYLRVLAGVSSYRLADNYLFLYNSGELVAVFTAA